jgi:hypothetical protein
VKCIHDKISIGKRKARRNSYKAQLEHVGTRIEFVFVIKDSVRHQKLQEVFSRKKTTIEVATFPTTFISQIN